MSRILSNRAKLCNRPLGVGSKSWLVLPSLLCPHPREGVMRRFGKSLSPNVRLETYLRKSNLNRRDTRASIPREYPATGWLKLLFTILQLV